MVGQTSVEQMGLFTFIEFYVWGCSLNVQKNQLFIIVQNLYVILKCVRANNDL